MVQEICKDIKRLDNAKRHLTYTITSLKRFHMLITAVDQLELMVETRQYHETANLLQAVSQLLLHFDKHHEMKTILKLSESVAKTRVFLTEQILADFEALSEVSADYSSMQGRNQSIRNQVDVAASPTEENSGGSLFLKDDGYGTNANPYGGGYDEPVTSSSSMFYSSDSQTPESLAGACAVVDALGSDVRRMLIDKVCEIWLAPYDTIFGPSGEHAGLEFTERRYAWLRRLLRDNEDKYESIFPQEWCMHRHLLSTFVKKTEKHLKTELGKIDPPDSADVSALVRALRKTLDFEHEMKLRFEVKRGQNEDDTNFDDDGQEIDPMSAEAIRQKYDSSKKRLKNTGSITEAVTGNELTSEIDDEQEQRRQEALSDATSLPSVKGMISSVFEPYLVAYVKLESEKMKEELNVVIREEGVETDGHLPLFSSASNMFLYIQKSINRCTQFTTGQSFYALFLEFRKILMNYSKMLAGKLPKPTKGLSLESATTISFVLNSAEYCADTIPQLEELIQGKIDNAYEESIQMEDERDCFYNNITDAVRALIGGIESIVEPDLVEYTKTNWAQFNEVHDESTYVTTLSSVLRQFIPQLRDLLNAVYFRTFCDKFAHSFLLKFTNHIYRCKRVGEVASSQLLLDTHTVKSLLLKMPTLGKEGETTEEEASLKAYTTFVEKEMERLEWLLKLVGMRLAPKLLIENFKLLWIGGTTEDFRRILEMKGVKKSDQINAIRLAKETGIQDLPHRPTTPNSNPPGQNGSSATDADGTGAATFTNVFSKMSDMRGQLDKVAVSTSGKTFSSFSANLSSSLQQSYNRYNRKEKS
uniref:Vps53 N-terminal domain-containing protein n=1 Tax=Mucochytrium quahogii TaxID=96639 RepID=A0A7S2S3J8_9STRA